MTQDEKIKRLETPCTITMPAVDWCVLKNALKEYSTALVKKSAVEKAIQLGSYHNQIVDQLPDSLFQDGAEWVMEDQTLLDVVVRRVMKRARDSAAVFVDRN